jgi:hypothetical protein
MRELGMNMRVCEPGNYRFIEGVFQYSGGVAALDGFEIVRVQFRRVLPVADGFAAIDRHLRDAGRPRTALCACELRSPAPFTEAGFRSFNELYVGRLAEWGIVEGGVNPVARTNVCPEIDPPGEPSFHAFSYTRPGRSSAASFVISGSGEVPEGRSSYRDHIVRPGDTSTGGLREKMRYVLRAMEERLSALGAGWTDTTHTQVYTVHDIHPLLASDLVRSGAARRGFTWHFDRPPVAGLDYEMDCRSTVAELFI